MKKIYILISVLLITVTSLPQQKITWNGYLQYRFTDNYYDQLNFSIRRAKVWLKGELPAGNDALEFKIQTLFQRSGKYQLQLEDAFVNYKSGSFEATAGQFTPDFSLQIKQRDFVIPLEERGLIIRSLIPGAETVDRDMGIELKISESKTGLFSVGFFNGNGANNPSTEKNFLYVNRGSLVIINKDKDALQFGYSLSYRKANKLTFNKILENNTLFSGDDFRFGFDGKLNLGNFELQSEYIQANLNKQKSYGYYIVADYLMAEKNIITLSAEQYHDLIASTNDNPWYILGYSRLLKGHDIKVTVSNRIQFTPDRTNSVTTIQMQYFFNQ